MIKEPLKAILIQGEFSDHMHLINVAGHEAKQIFKTNEKIRIVKVYQPDEYGTVVLVARPHAVDKIRPLVGRGGDKY